MYVSGGEEGGKNGCVSGEKEGGKHGCMSVKRPKERSMGVCDCRVRRKEWVCEWWRKKEGRMVV